jgi:hypothetical protein
MKKDFDKILEQDFVGLEIEEGMALPDMVEAVIARVTAHLRGSQTLWNYLESIPKGQGTNCPDSPTEELRRYIAMRSGQIDQSDPQIMLDFCRDFVFAAAEFERKTILKFLDKSDATDEEKKLFKFSFKLAPLIDQLYFRWSELVVVPFQSLAENERAEMKKQIVASLPEFDYTVDLAGVRQPWAIAFPEEIKAISELIENFLSGETSQEIGDYFRALKEAYACGELDQLEKVWEEVDRQWIKIMSGRLVPVHGMEEGYEYPCRVTPEYRLTVRVDKGKDLIQTVRARVPQVVEDLGAQRETVSEKLEKMDIGIFLTGVWSGVSLSFRLAGQVVPNRESIAIAGGKIFIDQDSLKNSIELMREAIDKHCSDVSKTILKELITIETLVEDVAEHECFHPAGWKPNMDSALRILEEAKATIGGQVIMPPSKETVARMIARILRLFHRTTLEDQASVAYVLECKAACALLFEAGIIFMEHGKLGVALDDEKVKAYFAGSRVFAAGVIKAYNENDAEAIANMEKRYCRSAFIDQLIEYVNRW